MVGLNKEAEFQGELVELETREDMDVSDNMNEDQEQALHAVENANLEAKVVFG